MSEKIKILYPIDFSDVTDNAFSTALNLCTTYDAEMFMIHVLEAPTAAMKLFSNFDEEGARKKAMQMMDTFWEKHGDDSVLLNKVVKIGKPYKKILETAMELDTNAIVMGTHGADGVSEILVGTNAARVIRTAPCPVITLRRKPNHLGFRKILLPLDLSKETGEKLDLGMEFAKNWNAELVILSVMESNDDEAKKRLQKRMIMAVNHCRKHGVAAESTTLVSKGNIADLVIEYGREIGADLICIMTQQELDFKQTFMGSNASHVVNHSEIPVMSIKPKREYKSANFAGSHFG